MDSIHDMRFVNTYVSYYLQRSPEKFLHIDENYKNKNHLENFPHKWQHFLPFLLSVAGLLRMEAEAMVKQILSLLAEKNDNPVIGHAITMV